MSINQQWRNFQFQDLEEGPIKAICIWEMSSALVYVPQPATQFRHAAYVCGTQKGC